MAISYFSVVLIIFPRISFELTLLLQTFFTSTSQNNCVDPGNIRTLPKEGFWLDSPTSLEIPV